MAKLYFRYGPMGCGKTLQLLAVAYNYEDRGLQVVAMKPLLDTKGDTKIIARANIYREADHLIAPGDDLVALIREKFPSASCVLVDEAQFLSREHVEQLADITIELGISVITYGLRTDRFGETWTGSAHLLAIADSLEEIKTICSCGKKATMTIAYMNGVLQTDGAQDLIDDGSTPIDYRASCRACRKKLFARAAR